MSETIAFLDLETTGLDPIQGHRPTEVAVVFVNSRRIVDRMETLINPGQKISEEIEEKTGISNYMVRNAPNPVQAISKIARKIGDIPIIAHNASFDQKFFDIEFSKTGRKRKSNFCCSIRVARRVLPRAPNYQLGTLVKYVGLIFDGPAHRAMPDAEMTAKLWIEMEKRLERDYRLAHVPFDLMVRLQTARIASVGDVVRKYADKHGLARMPKRGRGPGKKSYLQRRKELRDQYRGGEGDDSKLRVDRMVSAHLVCDNCGGRKTVQTTSKSSWLNCPDCGFSRKRVS